MSWLTIHPPRGRISACPERDGRRLADQSRQKIPPNLLNISMFFVVTCHQGIFSRVWRHTMQELLNEIPDAMVLLSLEPEELAAKILFLLRKRDATTTLNNLESELWQPSPSQAQYPREKKNEISLALTEAWTWLEAQGLIVQDPDQSGHSWRILSRRARKIETQAEFASFKVARCLRRSCFIQKLLTLCGERLCGVTLMGQLSTR